MTNFSFALALNTGPSPNNNNPARPEKDCHHHRQPEGGRGPEKPERNEFLDFLTAPLQMLGKGGNQNDKEYDKYLAANQAGNLLKG
ncbi:MAG: hypothetical protein U0931_35725 [Vulcanimicrobiota bacterium]